MSDNCKHGTISKLELTFNHETFALDVGGAVVNHDCALSMLQQATRYFEGLLRAQGALQLQAQLQRQREDVVLANALRTTA